MAKDKEFNEVGEDQDITIEADYNPLNEPVNEKPYTKPNVQIDPKDLAGDIPEPAFQPPPLTPNDPPTEQKSAPKPPPQPKPEPFNPELADASRKQAKTAAGLAANMILQGYELLHVWGNKLVQMPEKKLRKLHIEDKINLNMAIPYDETGETMRIAEFIQEYNQQNANLLSVDPEFKAEVLPVLTEVLQKRGIGATPEQQLIFLFAKDAAPKGMQIFASNAMKKEMINMWISWYDEMKRQGTAPSSQVPPPMSAAPTDTPPPPAPDSYTPTEEIVDEFDPLNEQRQQQEPYVPSVNEVVEQMTNPDGYAAKQQQQKAAEPTKKRRGRRSNKDKGIN